MISKQKIADLIEEKLAGTDMFLVELSVSATNQIIVYIDGDQGVKISDCVSLSRHIESNLDRETEDFELDVSSAGLDLGLRNKRQYQKNIGREVEIKFLDGSKTKGILKAVEEDFFQLDLPASKKKKESGSEENLIKNIDFKEIKETKVVISFK